MTKFVVDTWAWIEYLDATPKGEKVRDIIEDERSEVYSSAVSLAEVVSAFVSRGSDPAIATGSVTSLSRVVSVDSDLAEKAGGVHAEMRRKISDFGMGDAFVIVTAEKMGAKILTGDKHFKNVKGAILL